MLVTISSLLAKDIIVEDTRVLWDDMSQPFYFPVYTLDGESILMTQSAYSGLWIMNRTTKESRQLTDSQGAGYEPRSLKDGTIIYRHDEYSQGRKFTSLYKSDHKGNHLISEAARFVSPANLINDRLIYLVGETPIILNPVSTLREANLEDYTPVLNDKLVMKLYQGGVETIIAPQGAGNYIWSELSPGGDHIVYIKTGQGAFVCDLKGNIVSELGDIHAPQWSPDGEFLVYMDDRDDGVQYTASEIWVVSYDGTQSWKITDTSDIIEMYPQWSPDGMRLVYHSLSGEIIETLIKIVE